MGKFINLLVAYQKPDGSSISFDDQAKVILDAAQKSLDNGAKGVGFIYSANYGQTRDIEQTYFSGGWNTNTSGANQAQVVMAVEKFLGGKYSQLQGKLHILPITTMNAYDDPIDNWNVDLHIGILNTDLDRTKNYLRSGWDVLGIEDQNSNAKKPYAIGGKIANMGKRENDFIQDFLISLSKAFPNT